MSTTYGIADPTLGTETLGSGGLFYGSHGMPRCSCWVSFTTNPGDTPVWEDVTNYLRAFSVKRGRQYELDQFAAGTATITLDNRDRRFDPTYTSSPYYPNVVPMRRIQLRATWGIEYTVFDGYVDAWPQSYQVPHEARVDVTATDAFKVLSLSQMAGSVYEYEVRQDAPLHWYRLGEKQGAIAADSGSSPVSGSLNGALNYSATGSSPYDSDTAMEFVDPSAHGGGYFTAPVGLPSGDWTLELWIRDLKSNTYICSMTADQQGGPYWYLDPTINEVTDGSGNFLHWAVTLDFSIWNATLTSLVSVNHFTGINFLADAGWHHIAVTLSGTTLTLYADGQFLASTTCSSRFLAGHIFSTSRGVVAGAVIAEDEIAIYNTALSAARIAAHYNAAVVAWAGETSNTRVTRALDTAKFSSTARNIEAGVSTLGAAVLNNQTVDEHVKQVEFAEAGAFFFAADGTATFYNRHHLNQAPGRTPQATFGDAPGEQMYSDIVVNFDDTHIINEARVTRTGGTTQITSDSVSQGRYLARTFDQSDVHTETDDDSLYRSQDVVARFKAPALRIDSITVKPQRDPYNLWPLVLGLDLLDVITVNRRPQAIGSAISENVVIESVEHNVTPETWTTKYQLGQLPIAAGILDDPVYGLLDSTAVLVY